MTYANVADMVDSQSLRRRMLACTAQEGKVHPPDGPEAWLMPRIWEIVSTPGWEQAWAAAEAGGIPDPGGNEGVITDGMVLSAIQPMP